MKCSIAKHLYPHFSLMKLLNVAMHLEIKTYHDTLIYLFGMRPFVPFTSPLHQSEEALLCRMTRSPCLKVSSAEERPVQSNKATPSSSAHQKQTQRNQLIQLLSLLLAQISKLCQTYHLFLLLFEIALILHLLPLLQSHCRHKKY